LLQSGESKHLSSTECVQTSFEFHDLGSRQVVARFDGDGLLLREVDRRLGLTARLAACFTDHRRPDKIEHSVEELVAQRV
jgi:hypothetical protein